VLSNKVFLYGKYTDIYLYVCLCVCVCVSDYVLMQLMTMYSCRKAV